MEGKKNIIEFYKSIYMLISFCKEKQGSKNPREHAKAAGLVGLYARPAQLY